MGVETVILHSLVNVGQAEVVSLPEVYDKVHVWPAFTDIDLWLGLLFAAACAFAAARIRRYRDET